MSYRKIMLQSNGEQSLLDGVFISALPQTHDSQPHMCFRAVAVNFERSRECRRSRVGGAPQPYACPMRKCSSGKRGSALSAFRRLAKAASTSPSSNWITPISRAAQAGVTVAEVDCGAAGGQRDFRLDYHRD